MSVYIAYTYRLSERRIIHKEGIHQCDISAGPDTKS